MPQDIQGPVYKTLNLSYQEDQHRFFITAQIEDDISGIEYAYAYVTNPAGSITKGDRLELNNSTNLYEGYITLDQYSESGEWKVSVLRCTDFAGNTKWTNLSEVNVTGNLNVTKNTKQDIQGPVYKTLNLSLSLIHI